MLKGSASGVLKLQDASGNITGLSNIGALTGALDIRSQGAKCDGKFVNDAVIATISGNSRSVTSASALFTSADVGKVGAAIAYASGQQYGFDFTVTGYTSPTVITINCTNSGIVSARSSVFWGTDDSAAIDATINAANASSPKQSVFFPCAITCSAKASAHVFFDGVSVVGMGGLTTVDYSYKLSPVGSWIVLCKYTNTPFFQLGNTGTSSSIGSNISGVTVDGMNLCSVPVLDNDRASQRNNAAFIRGLAEMAFISASGVMNMCTIAGAEQLLALKIGGGDSRVTNSYIYGGGAGSPTVKIEGADILFAQNHLWRDSDVDPVGDLVLCNFYDGSANLGDITIAQNEFDTAVGANVNITITGNTTVRCINIIANHSLLNDAVQSNPSATFTGVVAANVLTASAVTGTIYPGAVLSGTGFTAGTRVLQQTGGTVGGAGTYTVTGAASVSSTSVTATGFPYISINIAAGSTLRLLKVSDNTGYGSWNDQTKSLYSSFIDGTGIKGSLLCLAVTDNLIDNCGQGYGSNGTNSGLLVPTYTAGNYNIINSASNTPVAF